MITIVLIICICIVLCKGGIEIQFRSPIEYHYGPEHWNEDHTMCWSWVRIVNPQERR